MSLNIYFHKNGYFVVLQVELVMNCGLFYNMKQKRVGVSPILIYHKTDQRNTGP